VVCLLSFVTQTPLAVGGLLMFRKCKIFGFILGFLCLLTAFAPQKAFAASANDPIATMCDDGSFDSQFQQQREATAQILYQNALNISAQNPIYPAMSQCLQNFVNVLKAVRAMGSANIWQAAGKALMFAAESMIANMITAACSSVMMLVNDVQQSVKNLTSICLPMPSFGLFPNLGFTPPPCWSPPPGLLPGGGGVLRLGLINSGFGSQPPLTYGGYTQYQQH
jgi:hypothetical protein